jgi:mercuric ion transport protein
MNSTLRSQDDEHADSGVFGGGRAACDRCRGDDATEVDPSRARSHIAGLLWVAGAFVFCPCHLPLTLWLFAGVLAGTSAGVLVQGHPFMTGILTTSVWLAATWHGMRLMRDSESPEHSG